MPPLILQQAFLHAPNTFKPVNHIGAMNNTRSTVLNKKWGLQHAFMSQNPSFISKSYLRSYLRVLSQNLSFISISFTVIFLYIVTKSKLYLHKFFYHYNSIHFPKTQPLSLYVLTTIFLCIVPKSKLYVYKVFTVIFP